MDSIIHYFTTWPEPVRLFVIFGLGLVVATQINRATYTLAFHRRAISPWSRPHPDAPPRHYSDRIPIFGWLGLRREASVHGTGFWQRPLLVECFFPCLLLYLYLWEWQGGLYDKGIFDLVTVQKQFLAHAVLLSLILVATLIDLDEKTIPDEITIPGTVVGLLIAATMPQSALPAGEQWLQLASPLSWPVSWDGRWGLILGLGSLGFWCAAMMTPRRLWMRSGPWRAIQFLLAKWARDPNRFRIGLVATLGTAGVILVWSGGGQAWQSLLSALAGVFFGTLLVWSVRLAASRALRKEALGFGDVTLMAMIGAFLGWQPTLFVFFLAPFLAIGIAVLGLILRGTREIPYGPYLSAAALGVILGWPMLWQRWGLLFILGWWIPAILLVCVALMWLMLWSYRRLGMRR